MVMENCLLASRCGKYGDHPPKLEDTLFGNRYLCRKGMGLLVGPSGQGKSSLILQGSIHWAAGRMFLGIRPTRPLKIAIFGCEDDDGDLYEIIRDARLALGLYRRGSLPGHH